MTIDRAVLNELLRFDPDTLTSALDVCKSISYYFFMASRDPHLDKKLLRAVKTNLDAQCQFISHIELAIREAHSAYSMVYPENDSVEEVTNND